MNPGYLGRNEVPESLKSSFRRICLETPDTRIISEVILFSFGFQEAKRLAEKLDSFYQACTKAFKPSDTKNYDFSLRNIKLLLKLAEKHFLSKRIAKEELIISRCISSVVLPAISLDDQPIFHHILSLHFPVTLSKSESRQNYDELQLFEGALRTVTKRMGLTLTTDVQEIIREIFEVMNARLGILLLGEAFTGKSTALEILCGVMTELNKMGDTNFLLPQKFLVNPMAQSIERLYGTFDEKSGDWQEGIIGDILKKMALSPFKRNLLIFDGPMQVEWTENLNSVLDDNAKISLPNGENITITNNNSIVFETYCITDISPATISRVGCINFNRNFQIWPLLINSIQNEQVLDLFDGLFPPCFEFLKSAGAPQVQPHVVVLSFKRMLESLLEKPFKEFGLKDEDGVQISFVFSLVWAWSTVLSSQFLQAFSVFLGKLLREPIKCSRKKEKIMRIENWNLPQDFKDATIFDYFLEDFRWKLFNERLEKAMKQISSLSLFIPTLRTVRAQYFTNFCYLRKLSFIIVGGADGGKTSIMAEFKKTLKRGDFILEAQGTPALTSTYFQDLMETRLEKRRKGVFGPLIGSQAYFWIDDLHCVSSPTVSEFLRSVAEHNIWFAKDRKTHEIVDTNLAISTRSNSNLRLEGRLTNFHMEEMSEKEQFSIFEKLTENFLTKFQVSSYSDIGLRMATLAECVLEFQKLSKNSFPSSLDKLFFTTSFRDSRKLLEATHSFGQPLLIHKEKQLKALLHETMRIFGDRFDENQQTTFLSKVLEILKEKYKLSNEALFKTLDFNGTISILQNLQFSDLFQKDNCYEQIKEVDDYFRDVEHILSSGKDFPIFESTLLHFSQFNRILCFPSSHALVIATNHDESLSILENLAKERKINLFKDPNSLEIETLIINAIVKQSQNTQLLVLSQNFIFQSKNSHIINLVLEKEFSPEMFGDDKIKEISERVNEEREKNGFSPFTFDEIISFSKENIRKNLHLFILANANQLDLFTIRDFCPQIYKHCTPIFISDWKESSYRKLAIQTLGNAISNENLEIVVPLLIKIHENELFKGEKPSNPSLFKKFISTTREILDSKSSEINHQITKYEIGLEKLASSFSSLAKLEEELKAKQPLLQVLKLEAENEAREIEAKAFELEPKKDKAADFEAIVKTKAEAAELSKIECEKELARVKPKLAQAEESILGLEAKHIETLRSMQRPPEAVKLVMEAFCILVQIPPVPVKDPKKPKETEKSYWEAAKKMLGEKDALKSILQFDKENIPAAISNTLRNQYISRTADFNPKRIEKASSAAKGICQWVLAVCEYDKILQNAKPTFERYAKAESDLIQIKEELLIAETELRTLESELGRLQSDYESKIHNIEKFRLEINACNEKVSRSQRLLQEFKAENVHWNSQLEKLKFSKNVLLSSAILTAAGLIYLGNLGTSQRQSSIGEWIQMCRQFSLVVNENWTLDSLLGDSLEFQKWEMHGLSLDLFSRENALIIMYSPKWPLIIDPSSLCSKWLKSLENENKVISTTEHAPQFLVMVEKAMELGYPLIIENVGSEMTLTVKGLLALKPKRNKSFKLNITGKEVEVSQYFKFFLLSKERSLDLSLFISNQISLINFSLTVSALTDQLLDISITKEKPELDEARSKLVQEFYQNRKTLREYDEKILNVLNSVEDFIADDSALEILVKSKEIGLEIERKESESKITESKIEETREHYTAFAKLASKLLLTVDSLDNLNSLYKFSTQTLMKLFAMAFDKAAKSAFLTQRLAAVQESFVNSLFSFAAKSLFSQAKEILSVLFFLRLKEDNFDGNDVELFSRRFEELDGNSEIVFGKLQESVKWLSNSSFPGLFQSLNRILSNSENPFLATFPSQLEKLNSLQKLILIRYLRPDKMMISIQSAVKAEIGKSFLENPQISIQSIFEESSCQNPILFLVENSDPSASIISFAAFKGRRIKVLGLHHKLFENILQEVKESLKVGNWVYLQNCHLAPDAYSFLEGIVESMAKEETSHPSFRLILSVSNDSYVPPTILQSSFIVAFENESGLNSTFSSILEADPVCDKNFFKKFRKTEILGLILLHYVILSRKKWGKIGWVKDYKFSNNDFYFALSEFMEMRNKSPDTLIQSISKFCHDCVYGIQMSSLSDLEILKIYCEEFYNEEIGDYLANFGFDESMDSDKLVKISKSLSKDLNGEELGFSKAIVYHHRIEEFQTLMNLLEKLYFSKFQKPSTQFNILSKQNIIQKLEFINKEFTSEFNLETLKIKFPISNFLNGFLLSELHTFNYITHELKCLSRRLTRLLSGNGESSMTDYKLAEDTARNIVPSCLSNRYSKTFEEFLANVKMKQQFYKEWISKGKINCFKLGCLLNPNAIIPAIKSYFALENRVEFEKLELDFDYCTEEIDPNSKDIFLENLAIKGAMFDFNKKVLVDCSPESIINALPKMKISMRKQSQKQKKFECPVFLDSQLSNLWHHMALKIEESPKIWVKKGVVIISRE